MGKRNKIAPQIKPENLHLPVSGELSKKPQHYFDDDPLTIDTSEE